MPTARRGTRARNKADPGPYTSRATIISRCCAPSASSCDGSRIRGRDGEKSAKTFARNSTIPGRPGAMGGTWVILTLSEADIAKVLKYERLIPAMEKALALLGATRVTAA